MRLLVTAVGERVFNSSVDGVVDCLPVDAFAFLVRFGSQVGRLLRLLSLCEGGSPSLSLGRWQLGVKVTWAVSSLRSLRT